MDKNLIDTTSTVQLEPRINGNEGVWFYDIHINHYRYLKSNPF